MTQLLRMAFLALLTTISIPGMTAVLSPEPAVTAPLQPVASQAIDLLQDRRPDARPTLMVLGAPHFANHNRDVANLEVPNVLTPIRQQEIAAIAEALARFRPTHIAVEWPSTLQAP